jgi:hypothetical protein
LPTGIETYGTKYGKLAELVRVPLAHVPDHTWLGMSEEQWAVNLDMYATQPERFLQLQCEGECWCKPPDARARA